MAHFDLIASDIDGTLLTSAKTVSPRTHEALRAARENGTTLMLASGRPAWGIRHVAQSNGIELEGLVVAASNGSEVSDATTGEVIAATPLPRDVAAQAIEVASSLGLAAMTMAGDTVYTTKLDGDMVEHEASANGMKLAYSPDFRELVSIPKIVIGVRPERMAAARIRLDRELSPIAETAQSAPYFYEVTHAGVHKGTGLLAYCEARGVDVSRAIAFGDEENDIPLLKAAGRGVAMGNAAASVKAIADAVTRSNDEDGIVWALA